MKYVECRDFFALVWNIFSVGVRTFCIFFFFREYNPLTWPRAGRADRVARAAIVLT